MTDGALWRRYVNLSQDMTGVGEFINDPTEAWDCAPPRDDEWIDNYVKQHVDNELHRVSWMERQKKSQALRAKQGLSWPQARARREDVKTTKR